MAQNSVTKNDVYCVNHKKFGSTDLYVSEIGMGCSSLGGLLYRDGDQEAIRTLQKALDYGINFFDTADSYSFGNSERLIGKAFEGKREQVIIATKVGSKFTPMQKFTSPAKSLLRPLRQILLPFKRYFNMLRHSEGQRDYSAKHLQQAIDASLSRLHTDYIDVYQLHSPPRSVLEAGDFCATLERLKKEGKIRYYGVSCRTVEDVLTCLRYPGLSSIQIPVSLLDQRATNELIPLAAKKGVAIIAREPLAQGLLTGQQKGTLAEQSARSVKEIKERKRRANEFRFLATNERTMAQAAIQFVLQIPGVSTVIPGAVDRDHLKENLGALAAPPLTSEELAKI